MLFLLFTVPLFLQGSRADQFYSNYIIEQINSCRSEPTTFNLPPSTSMFALENDLVLELYAGINAEGCQSANFFPSGGSLNYYTAPLQANGDYQTMISDALGYWSSLIQGIFLDNNNDPTYSNKNQSQELANMFYYKSVKAGCTYVTCNKSEPAMYAVSCVFNSAPKLGEPIYISSATDYTACQENSDCTEYLPFSTCATTSTNTTVQGLCYAGNVTTFPTASTTTPSTTTTTATTTTTTTTTATTTTATTTTTTTSSTTQTNPPFCMTETLREKIILMHNFRRSRLAQGLVPNGLSDRKNPSGQNIYNMSYSTTLESEAQMYANACPESGSPAESRTTGENFGTVPTSSAKTYYDAVVQAIKAFWHEIIVTEINKEMKFTYMLTQRNLTRFTQMAWAKTYEVGCGANLCGENYVVVCRYNPRGNIVWEYIYETGKMCGNCTSSCTTAYLTRGLCPNPSSPSSSSSSMETTTTQLPWTTLHA